MKRIRMAALWLTALLFLGLVCRNAQAQYIFIGDLAGAPPSSIMLLYDLSGQFVDYERPNPLVNSLFDLKVGPDGNLYGIQGNTTMVVFNGSNGAFLGSFGLPFTPSALAFGPDGNIYLALSQTGIYKLQGPVNIPPKSYLGKNLGLFASASSYITSMTFHSGAGGASCELLACVGGAIARYNAQGVFQGNLSSSVAINNISVGPNGDIFAWYQTGQFGNFGPLYNWIGRYSGKTYQFLNAIAGLGKRTSANQLMYMVWGPDNSLYVANYKGDGTATDNIVKITPVNDAQGKPDFSQFANVTTFISGLNVPLAITFVQQPLGQAFPQTYSNQVAFRETGGSIWGTGSSSATASYTLGPTWDTGGTVTAGGFDDIFLVGTFGAALSVNSHGTAGLRFSATASGGSVNINYPVEVTMDFGDRNYLFAGDWNPVHTSYKIDAAANLGTLAPHASAGIDAVMNGYFRAEGKAEAFSATIFDEVIMPPAGSDPTGNGFFDYGRNIINTDDILGSQPKQNYSLLGGIISGYVKVPNITTAGMPNPNATDPRVIQTTGQDTFFNMRGSVSNLVRQIIQDVTGVYVPLGNDSVSEHFLGTGFDLGYSLMNLYANVDVNVKQDFKFAPVPHVKLQLPSGQTVNWRDKTGAEHDGVNALEFDAGDTFQIQMPSDPILLLTPTYTLPNTFTHTLSLVINPSLDLTPLEITGSGSVAGFSLGSFDFKPIDTIDLANTSIAFPLVTKSFTLPGFQTLTQQAITVSGRLHPAPALASAMPSQIPLVIVPYNYNSTTLPDNVVNGTTQVTVMGMTFPTTGSHAYFTIHGSVPLPLPTTFVDNCTLHVSIPNRYLLIAGTGQLYVTIPNSAGNSNSLDIQIVNPVPQIKNTGPNVYAADPNLGGNLLMTVTDQSTTFLWSADYYNILQSKWFATYNGTPTNSNMAAFFSGYDFNAVTPLPAIHFKGSDGIDHTLALYQESNPSGLLWAVLPLEFYAKPDTAQVTVIAPAPGGGVSNVLPLTIGTAVPQVTSLDPSVVLPGSGAFRLEVLGPLSPNAPPNPGPYGNFNGTSTICWDGQPLPTTFVTAGDLYTDIPASYVAAAGTHTIKVVSTVYNGQGGGTTTLTSNLLNFAIRSFSPTIKAVPGATIALYPGTIVSADRAFLGSPNAPQYNLTVNGQNFVNGSVIQWNGTALTTQFVNDTMLTATVPYANVGQPGTAQVTVSNPTAGGGGGVSNPATFTIVNAKPGDTVLTPLTLSALSPNFAKSGGSSATITVVGEGFYAGSIVKVNGNARTTTFAAHNSLTVTLTAADIATAGTTLQLTVINPAPSGGTTPALPLFVGASSISGTLTLEGIASGAAAQSVTFTCRPSDNSGDVTRTALVAPNGAFAIGGLPKKNYTLHIKGDKYLAVNISANTTSHDVTGLTATLPAGDANNDNSVDLGDFGLLVNAFGGVASDPTSGYDFRVDFNGDGNVDIGDFGLLVNNFGSVGAP